MEPRICELREDYALRKIPTASLPPTRYTGNHSLAYNSGHCVSAELLEEIVAEPDA